jgi:hypothetical protein
VDHLPIGSTGGVNLKAATEPLTREQERVLRERMHACPTCGAKPGVKCVSTSRSVTRKRSASAYFEWGVHNARKDLLFLSE